jgi:hypothetical protein
MSVFLFLRLWVRNIIFLYIYYFACSLLCRGLLIYITYYLIYCLRRYNRLNQFIIVILILENPKNITLIDLVCCVIISRLNFLLIVLNILIVIVVILIIKCVIICLPKAYEDSPVALRTRLLFLIDLLIKRIPHWAFPRKSPSNLEVDPHIRNPAKSLYPPIAIENPSFRIDYSPVLLISVITVVL